MHSPLPPPLRAVCGPHRWLGELVTFLVDSKLPQAPASPTPDLSPPGQDWGSISSKRLSDLCPGPQGQGLGRAGWEGKTRGIWEKCHRGKLPGTDSAPGKPSVVTSRDGHTGKAEGLAMAEQRRRVVGISLRLPQRLREQKQTSAPAEGMSGAQRKGSRAQGGIASSDMPAHPPAAPPALTCSHLDLSRSGPLRGFHWAGRGPDTGAGRPSHAPPTSDPCYNVHEPRGHDAECKELVTGSHTA